ncbi:MAG: hypothetical protein ABI707_05755 [Ferruginibacter sp.]
MHSVNILTHITAGTIALLFGIIALTTRKGGRTHKRVGKLFLMLLIFVIITGLLGVFVFNRNTFLLVITVLSAYNGFSGYRILQTKSNEPKLPDISVAIISLISVSYFLYYFNSIGMIWAPVIIYSTVGALLFLITYDFARYLIPRAKYKKLWLYEHIYKMIGAFTALLAAFIGTVFVKYQPYSQVLPSVLGILLQIGFIVYYYRKDNHAIQELNNNDKKQHTAMQNIVH